MKTLLEKRNRLKSKKPAFVRKDSNKYNFKNKWRKPRGIHNKRRLNKKGHQRNPSIGYGSPNLVKHLTKDGLNRINVQTLSDLNYVNKDKDILVISSSVGLRKKIEILNKAIELGFKTENIRDPKKFIDDIKLRKEQEKKEKQKKVQDKEKSKKEAEKKKKEQEEKTSEEKQKEVKEDVLKAKQEIKAQKEINVKQDTAKSKLGHMQSSVPGGKQ